MSEPKVKELKNKSAYRNKPKNLGIIIPVIFLVIIGVLMIYSSSSVQAGYLQGDELYFFKRQLIFTSVGFVAMLVGSKINYKLYFTFAKIIFILNIALLIATKYSPLSVTANETTRWLNLGFFQFQTSEFTKLANIIMLSAYIKRNEGKMNKFTMGGKAFLLIIMPSFILVATQPSFSAALTIAVVGFAMLFVGGMSLREALGLFSLSILGAVALVIVKPYRMKRLMTFLNPFSDLRGAGWQVANSIYAIASGGIQGVGYGKGVQKFFYIAEPQNDFIFASIAEEIGLMGCILLIIIYVYLIINIFHLFETTTDVFPQMLVAGIGIQIGLQAFMNIAVTTSLIPNTGIGLPFVSYGGTSIVIFMYMVGILINISNKQKITISKGRRR